MRFPNKFIAYILLSGLSMIPVSCSDFLDKNPLDSISMGTFWTSQEQAEMWVNNLYRSVDESMRGLGSIHITTQEAYSDNAYGRTSGALNNIASGTFQPNDARVADAWDYSTIRLCHEFFDNIDRIGTMPASKRNELTGQVKFFLAYEYFKLITRFRDVPLVTGVLALSESDVSIARKSEVLDYLLLQLDEAIEALPASWPENQTGRVTKGAALFLKARVLLYNERWPEAASVAREVIDMKKYALQPRFQELFLTSFNNKKPEAILELQYVENVQTHNLSGRFAPVTYGGQALILPSRELVDAFEMRDGKSIQESSLYNPRKPFDNRDPRFYDTFLWHGQVLNDSYPPLDVTGSESNFAFTYMYFRKGIVDFRNRFLPMYLNWNLFRYADLLLMYAEARNEASGPDESVYEVVDQIRTRAGMPPVDRQQYADQAGLRKLIRNERRIELAGEGLRYDDIIRWKIADQVLNIQLKSLDLSQWEDAPKDANGNSLLIEKNVQARIFDPAKHYVWPIPQVAIDQATKLVQHPEWQ